MRNFKTVVVTLLLIGLASLVLWWIKGFLPGMGPSEQDLNEIYHDHEEVPLDDIYQTEIKQYEGDVKILGVSLYQEATHRLEQDNRLVVLLKSDTIALDDYLNKTVKVSGILSDTASGAQKLMNVTKIEVVSEEGTKSFDDLRFEMSFDYPNGWDYKVEDKKVTFTQTTKEGEQTLMLVYQYDSENQPLDVWLKDRDQNLFYDESEVAVGNMTGIRRVIKNGEDQILKTYLKAGANFYELRLTAQDESTKNQYLDLLESFESHSDAIMEEATEDLDAEAKANTPEESATEEPEVMEQEESASSEVDKMEVKEDESGGATSSSSGSGDSFTSLSPLSSSEIQNAVEKGFSPFEGRSLSFQYPKAWYFSYLGDQQYGFTDHTAYTENGGEISTGISRVMIVAGDKSVSCSSEEKRTISGVSYTVCAREPGLGELIKKMADSLK